MSDIMSSFGLDFDNLDMFGFGEETAISSFGAPAIVEFVEAAFEYALPVLNAWSATDYFAFAQQADAAIEELGFDEEFGFSYVDYLNQVNASLLESTGKTLNDLSFSADANGNFTAVLDGVGTGTINIFDAINDALSDPSVRDQLDDAFDQIDGIMPGLLGDDSDDFGDLIGDLIAGGFDALGDLSLIDPLTLIAA